MQRAGVQDWTGFLVVTQCRIQALGKQKPDVFLMGRVPWTKNITENLYKNYRSVAGVQLVACLTNVDEHAERPVFDSQHRINWSWWGMPVISTLRKWV